MDIHHLLAATLVILGLLGSGLVSARRHAREGYEDERGFHYGRHPQLRRWTRK